MTEYVVTRGDAFDLLEDLPDGHVHAAVVDYPWEYGDGTTTGRASFHRPDDWDMADNSGIVDVLEDVARVAVDGAYVFVFADDDVLPTFRRATERVLEYRKTLIWDTERIGNGHYFRSRHGYIICATVDETDRYVTDRPTVLEAVAPQREPGETTEYPTEKPASLYHQFLEPVVRRGERILEPFCGTAPALEVAKSLECSYWGCDTSDHALRRARRRGRQATLEGV